MASNPRATERGTKNLGGWLILQGAIVLVTGVFFSISRLIYLLEDPSFSLPTSRGAMPFVLLAVFKLLGAGATLLLMVRRSRSFRTLAISYFLFSAFIETGVVVAFSPGLRASGLVVPTVMRGLISNLVWVGYLLFSVRVAQVFPDSGSKETTPAS